MHKDLPKYHELMLPLLQEFADGKPAQWWTYEDAVARKLNVSAEMQDLAYPNQKQHHMLVFKDRLGWAKTYIYKAKLLEQVEKGVYKITARGKELLRQNPPAITVKLLREYPDFWDQHVWKSAKAKDSGGESLAGTEDQTPEELIGDTVATLREGIKQELLTRLKGIHPHQFEILVVELLEKMGYGIGEVTRYSRDGGIDGLVKGDYLGFEMVYVQAKRWESNVRRQDVSQFIGDILRQGAKKGIFITTSDFTSDAKTAAHANGPHVIFINGSDLTNHMIDLGLGVTVQESYSIFKIDTDYLQEG